MRAALALDLIECMPEGQCCAIRARTRQRNQRVGDGNDAR